MKIVEFRSFQSWGNQIISNSKLLESFQSNAFKHSVQNSPNAEKTRPMVNRILKSTVSPFLKLFRSSPRHFSSCCAIQTEKCLKTPNHCMRIWYANYMSWLDKANHCRSSKVLMDDCYQAKDVYSGIQESYIRHTRW